MNCPRCNSASIEGKRYCADCGAPLDPQSSYIETVVNARVDETIREKLRDQKLVEIETSQAIVERLYGWAKLFAFFVALPLAVLAIVLSIGGIEKYSDFKKLVAGIEEKVQPQVERAKSDAEQAEQTAQLAKNDAENARKTIQGASSEAQKQLGSVTRLVGNVESLSARVSTLEQQTSKQIKGSGQRVDAQVAGLNQKIDAATKNIAEQQKKLENTNDLVKSLFSRQTTEYFATSTHSPNVEIVPLSHKGAFVFMLLKEAPISQTVDLKWRIYSQPRNSYSVSNNILTFVWGDPADTLKQYPIEVTYVPDPTSKVAPFKTLSLRDKGVFADDTKIMDAPWIKSSPATPETKK